MQSFNIFGYTELREFRYCVTYVFDVKFAKKLYWWKDFKGTQYTGWRKLNKAILSYKDYFPFDEQNLKKAYSTCQHIL